MLVQDRKRLMNGVQLMIDSLQEWLLDQGRCVGCGRLLSQGRQRQKNGYFLITCSCHKIFAYHPDTGSYQMVVPQTRKGLKKDLALDNLQISD